jgi:hypothetical protein
MFIYLDAAVAVALQIGRITAYSLATPQPAAPAFDYAYYVEPDEANQHLLRASPFLPATK